MSNANITKQDHEEWMANPLTKALKQFYEDRIQKLESQLGEAVWNYGELKRQVEEKEWVGFTEEEFIFWSHYCVAGDLADIINALREKNT